MWLYVILNEVKDLGCLMLRSFATEAQDDKLTVTLNAVKDLNRSSDGNGQVIRIKPPPGRGTKGVGFLSVGV